MTSRASSPSSSTPESKGAGTVLDATRHLTDCPDLLTVRDLCDLTSLSAQTIRAEINGGNLPGCRIGRRLFVSKSHFIDYIENGGGLRDHM